MILSNRRVWIYGVFNCWIASKCRKRGSDAAGFYNYRCLKRSDEKRSNLRKILISFSIQLTSKAQSRGLSNLEYFKEVLEALPRGTFWDLLSQFKGSAEVNGKTRDVISTLLWKRRGYFEEDEWNRREVFMSNKGSVY